MNTVQNPNPNPATPVSPTTAGDNKPGIRSTEFWLSTIATIAGIALASGLIAEGSTASQIVGGIMAVLSQLGYTASRTQLKRWNQ